MSSDIVSNKTQMAFPFNSSDSLIVKYLGVVYK